MNVSGVRPYDGFYQYNSIRLSELRNAQIAATENQVAAPVESVDEATKVTQPSAEVRQNQTFSSFDLAQQYNPNETFDLKGVDSDINSLDVQKAISNLDKDSMIQQYQYFVDNNQTDLGTAALRMDENFML